MTGDSRGGEWAFGSEDQTLDTGEKGPPSPFVLGYDKFLAKTSPALISLIESVIKQVGLRHAPRRLQGWVPSPNSWVFCREVLCG